jgi:hypothetical protein
MPRKPIPFGGGLSREPGLLVTAEGSFEDIRNFLLLQGKAQLFPGFAQAVEILDGDTGAPVSRILAGYALRSDRIGVVVSWQDQSPAAGRVWVHRIDADATAAELVGEWVNDRAAGWGTSPPRISMTEVGGRVFMAHNHRQILQRAPTKLYDTFFGAGFATLTSDLGAGSETIRFRGVVDRLVYLFGWAYGTDAEDRPEVVRYSTANDPTVFEEDGYLPMGSRRDAVVQCVPVGGDPGGLVAFKEGATYVIEGSGPGDFRRFLRDPLNGVLGGAGGLAVNVGGVVIGWSAEGPKVWDGSGPGADLAIPLELRGPDPATLVAEGAIESAFATYVHELHCAAFVFGQRAYVLNVRVPGDWKWSYGEWLPATELLCAFTLYTGAVLQGAPTVVPVLQSISAGGSYADITVVNAGTDGDETLQVWARKTTDAWAAVPAKIVAVQGTSQIVRITNTDGTPDTGLEVGLTYDVALRYVRGGQFSPGAENTADPGSWPAASQGQFVTVSDPPTVDTTVWSRTAAAVEQVAVTFTPTNAVDDVEIFRDGEAVGVVTAAQHLGAQDTFDDVQDQAANQLTFPEAFDNAAWVKAQATVVADQATDPDGGTGMDLLKEDATAASVHSAHQDIVKAAAEEDWILSARVKKPLTNARPGIRLEVSDGAGNGYRIDQADVTLAAAAPAAFGTGFALLGSGKWAIDERTFGFWLLVTTNNVALVRGLVALHDGTSATYDGDNASGMYLWRAFANQQAFPDLPGETFVPFQARTLTTPASPLSTSQSRWVGPPPFLKIDWGVGADQAYQVSFSDHDVAFATEVWDNYDDATGTVVATFTLRGEVGAGANTFQSGILPNYPLDGEGFPVDLEIQVKVRQRKQTSGTDDFSRFSGQKTVFIQGGEFA